MIVKMTSDQTTTLCVTVIITEKWSSTDWGHLDLLTTIIWVTSYGWMNVDFKYNVISRGAKKGGGRGLKNDDGQFLAWKSAIIFYSKERGGG